MYNLAHYFAILRAFFEVLGVLGGGGRTGGNPRASGNQGTLDSHGSSHRHAMDMGAGAYDRGHQITYSTRRLDYWDVILTTWCGVKWFLHS
jgi:hypothetical protein